MANMIKIIAITVEATVEMLAERQKESNSTPLAFKNKDWYEDPDNEKFLEFWR